MNQSVSTQSFHLNDGTEIHTVIHRSTAKKIHGDVLMVHGFGDHSGLYVNMISVLNEAGYNTFGFDSRGHGLSGGVRGRADGIAQMVADLDQVYDYFTAKHGMHTPILYGHSLGAVVALDYAIGHQSKLKAVFSSSAGLSVHLSGLIIFKQTIARFIAYIAPSLRFSAGLDINYLSHDEFSVKRYAKDPLVHGKISAKFGLDLLDYGAGVIGKAHRLHIPVFLVHGSADKITNPAGTVKFYENCLSDDKTIFLYPGLYHEMHNEPEELRSAYISDLKDWLKKQLKLND
jgi:alpha-beta hydrolase superfamily lysophospholipase